MNKSLQKKLMQVITICILLISTAASWAQTAVPDENGILYVKKGATGDGSSWANALGEVADGLKAAKELAAGAVAEIWVSGGTYKPLYRADTYDGTNPVDRSNSFVLVKNVKMYGGFAGTETLFTERNLALTANSSILTGDFSENDVVTGTGATLAITLNTENAAHIVISTASISNPVTSATVLDGFTIMRGNSANAPALAVNGVSISGNGGGMFNSNYSSPTLSNLIIKENSGTNQGGGICNAYTSSPLITNCIFSNNLLKTNSSSRGGAIMNVASSAPIITNTIISGNRSQGSGGGISNDNSSPILTNVTIVGNRAPTGGGIYNNSALSNSKIRNSIIYNNAASSGPNIYNSSGGTAVMTNSLVQGITTADANGNIDGATDPLFVDATVDNYMLQLGSPVIDAGSNSFFASGSTPDLSGITTDLIGNHRIYGGTVDMGAYELMNCTTPEAPTAAAQIFCLTGTVADLTATTADGGEAKWYATDDATEALDDTTALVTQTYYVSQIIDICESPKTAVSVTVNATPEAPTAEAQTFCGSTALTSLVPSPSAGILWYDSADATVALTDDAILTTQTYYVSQKTGDCEGPKTPVTVVVNTPDPIVTSQTLCEGATVSQLEVTSIPDSLVQWYAGGTFGEVLPNTYHLTTGSYYVSQTIGTCESRRILITVTIAPLTLPDFAEIAPMCAGSTAPVLEVVSPNGIAGTWSPSEIVTTESGTSEYVFTPTEGILTCTAPQTLSVTINPKTTPDFADIVAFCQGSEAPVLGLVSPNGITGTWSPAVIDNTQAGNFDYVFTPAEGECATIQTLSITVTPKVTPDFAEIAAFCQGSDTPVLELVSPNGITGTWSPAVIDNAQAGNFDYVFTPAEGECATTQTLSITVTPKVTPDFAEIAAFCVGSEAPVLELVSPNNITGTWSPATIDNSQAGTFDYLFTPAEGECATTQTLSITVSPKVVPDFAEIAAFCQGSEAPVLELVSPNNVTGTWSPAIIDNSQAGTLDYLFTPAEGECATTQILSVTVNNLTAAPTGEETQDFTGGETLADFDVTGENIKWYDAPIDGNELTATDLIVAGGVYYASQTLVSGCGESVNRLKIIAGIDLATATFDTDNFKYYPNPVTDILTINYSKAIDSVEVFNLLGQMVMDKKINDNNYKLNFSDLASGSYLVKVVSGETSKVLKVVKK